MLSSYLSATLVALVIGAAVWATYTDLRVRHIANRLTLGCAAGALLIRLILGGPSALVSGAAGWALGIAALAVPFVLGWLGGGDVKLVAAIGACGGPVFAAEAFLLSCLAAGAMAAATVALHGPFGQQLWWRLARLLDGGTLSFRRIPFAPALLFGVVGALAGGGRLS